MMNSKNILTVITGISFCAGFANGACDRAAVTGATLGGALTYIVSIIIVGVLICVCCVKQGKYTKEGIKCYYNRTVVKVTFAVAFILSVLTSVFVGYFALGQDNNCWKPMGAYGLGVGIASGYFLLYHCGVGCFNASQKRCPKEGEKSRLESTGKVSPPPPYFEKPITQ